MKSSALDCAQKLVNELILITTNNDEGDLVVMERYAEDLEKMLSEWECILSTKKTLNQNNFLIDENDVSCFMWYVLIVLYCCYYNVNKEYFYLFCCPHFCTTTNIDQFMRIAIYVFRTGKAMVLIGDIWPNNHKVWLILI